MTTKYTHNFVSASEHVSSENGCLHSTGWWSRWSSYVPTIKKQTSLNKPTSKLKLFQKWSYVSKLNHAVMNKKQGNQITFSLKTKRKSLWKKKMDSSHSLSTHYTIQWIVIKWVNRFINSKRKFFNLPLYAFHTTSKNQTCDEIKISENWW